MRMHFAVKPEEQKCMEFSIKMFRIVGCWPYFRDKKKKSEQLYLCYTTAVCAVLSIYVLILAYGLWAHYKFWKSMEEAIEELIVFATGAIVLLKLCLIIWNQSKLQKIIDFINRDLIIRQVRDEEDNSVIRACIKHERSLAKTFLSFGYCITTLYTASSVIRIIRERPTGGEQYTLPLKYPFFPRQFPMYHLTYLHQMMVMVLNGHIGTLADTFFSCLTYYVCGHFKIARNQIPKDGGIISKQFVYYHREIISLIASLQSIFGPYLNFQMTTNSLLLCLGLLQITQTANIKLLHFIKCVIYVTIKFSQMFLYCWYGQEVIQQSLSISTAVYCGKWHEPHTKNTIQNLRIVLLRSQKPVKMRAGIFFILSLPTLATAMNTAYSFFTMIKSTQKNEL